MKIGLIGTGRIGRVHTDNIQHFCKGHRITHAYDPFIDIDWIKKKNIQQTASVEALLNQDIQAVLICSPSFEHTHHIIAAAQKQKHIFCEKPIGLNLTQINKALQIVHEQKIILQIGFNRRFDPSFAKLKKDIQEKIGTPHIIRITSRDPECPSEDYIRNAGGIFLDMTIHDFDMARFLVGSEVSEVYATGSCLINNNFEKYNDIDTAITHIKFDNGTLGIIDNSRQAVYGYDQRIEVFSNKACLKVENYPNNNVQHYTNNTVTTAVLQNFFLERYQHAFVNQFKAFFEAIEKNTPALVSGFDGVAAFKIAQAAQKSFENQTLIKI